MIEKKLEVKRREFETEISPKCCPKIIIKIPGMEQSRRYFRLKKFQIFQRLGIVIDDIGV